MTISKYSFTDYSPEWPLEFAREQERLRSLLGDVLVAVHHIGSTSVPGLAAKPIIDLLPVVRDIQAYCQGKNAWIKQTEPLARQWFRSLSQPR